MSDIAEYVGNANAYGNLTSTGFVDANVTGVTFSVFLTLAIASPNNLRGILTGSFSAALLTIAAPAVVGRIRHFATVVYVIC